MGGSSANKILVFTKALPGSITNWVHSPKGKCLRELGCPLTVCCPNPTAFQDLFQMPLVFCSFSQYLIKSDFFLLGIPSVLSLFQVPPNRLLCLESYIYSWDWANWRSTMLSSDPAQNRHSIHICWTEGNLFCKGVVCKTLLRWELWVLRTRRRSWLSNGKKKRIPLKRSRKIYKVTRYWLRMPA